MSDASIWICPGCSRKFRLPAGTKPPRECQNCLQAAQAPVPAPVIDEAAFLADISSVASPPAPPPAPLPAAAALPVPATTSNRTSLFSSNSGCFMALTEKIAAACSAGVTILVAVILTAIIGTVVEERTDLALLCVGILTVHHLGLILNRLPPKP